MEYMSLRSITLDLQITDRNEVSIDAGTDRIIASPVSDSNLTLMVTNLAHQLKPSLLTSTVLRQVTSSQSVWTSYL